MTLAIRGAAFGSAVSVMLVAAISGADPTFACFPPGAGVRGLPGPPDWTDSGVQAQPIGAELDDPRWNGSMRDDLPQIGGVGSARGALRGLQDGASLYLSLLAVVDPNGVTTSYDAAYVGFGNGSVGSAKLVRVTLNGDNARDSTDFVLAAWRRTAGGWSTGPFPAWAEEIHVWTGTGTGTAHVSWGVNLRVNLAVLHADTDIGGTMTDPVRFVYALNINTHVAPPPPAATVPVWPQGTPFGLSNDIPILTMLPSGWGTMLVGTSSAACPSGISIIPENVGTLGPGGTGAVNGTLDQRGKAGSTNTFAATLGGSPATATVQARFRLADTGTVLGPSRWKDVPPAAVTPITNGDGTRPDLVTWMCDESLSAATACPAIPFAATSDCLLVELASAGGLSPLHFQSSSAERCLDVTRAVVGAEPSPDAGYRPDASVIAPGRGGSESDAATPAAAGSNGSGGSNGTGGEAAVTGTGGHTTNGVPDASALTPGGASGQPEKSSGCGCHLSGPLEGKGPSRLLFVVAACLAGRWRRQKRSESRGRPSL